MRMWDRAVSADNSPKPWTCVDCGEDQAAENTRFERLEGGFMTARWHGPMCLICNMKHGLHDDQESSDAV